MSEEQNSLHLREEDFQEIFALYCSSTRYELNQIYDSNSYHYYKKEKLAEEYESVSDKKEYAFDSLRAVLTWLHRRGYSLVRDGKTLDLGFVYDELYS